MNHLFRTVRDLVGATVEPIYAPPRAGDVKDSQADISKAKTLLGYTPIVPFEEGLDKTVAWYRATVPGVVHDDWNAPPQTGLPRKSCHSTTRPFRRQRVAICAQWRISCIRTCITIFFGVAVTL